MTRARIVDLALMLSAFVAGTLLAEMLGASNTAIAMTFGQLAFAATLAYVLLRR